jgi:pimeloyl-[acyl-carrier protein] methyl ester esterase
LQTDWYNTLQRFLALQVKGDEAARDLLRDLRRQFTPESAPSQAVLSQGLSLLRDTDLRNAIKALRCPTCVALGAQDALVPVAVKEDWLGLLADTPLALKLFPKAAHMPFASHLEAFTDHLYHWLHDNIYSPT